MCGRGRCAVSAGHGLGCRTPPCARADDHHVHLSVVVEYIAPLEPEFSMTALLLDQVISPAVPLFPQMLLIVIHLPHLGPMRVEAAEVFSGVVLRGRCLPKLR